MSKYYKIITHHQKIKNEASRVIPRVQSQEITYFGTAQLPPQTSLHSQCSLHYCFVFGQSRGPRTIYGLVLPLQSVSQFLLRRLYIMGFKDYHSSRPLLHSKTFLICHWGLAINHKMPYMSGIRQPLCSLRDENIRFSGLQSQ